jgi:hypothetical protein
VLLVLLLVLLLLLLLLVVVLVVVLLLLLVLQPLLAGPLRAPSLWLLRAAVQEFSAVELKELEMRWEEKLKLYVATAMPSRAWLRRADACRAATLAVCAAQCACERRQVGRRRRPQAVRAVARRSLCRAGCVGCRYGRRRWRRCRTAARWWQRGRTRCPCQGW